MKCFKQHLSRAWKPSHHKARRLGGRILAGTLLLAIVAAVSGCRTLGFYSQAVKGQYEIFAHEQPINKLLADGRTPASLRARLELLETLRAFAKSNLALPIDGHYRKYVDLHRPYVVWNVEAAPEFSLQPKTWWYPLVGSLEYRGYFAKAGATNYASLLRRQGYDVAVGGVQAYSTLGWFKDPVLNTFLFEPDADLAEILFHELGHQRVFARGDTDFNEAFATTVGQEGARRWLRAQGGQAAYTHYLAELQRTRQFTALVKDARQKLQALYGDTLTEEGKVKAARVKPSEPAAQLRHDKQLVLAELRADYARLKAQWGGATDYDDWFKGDLNNAQLNSVAAYYDLVPGFERLLQLNGGDLEKFYQAAERLTKMNKKTRRAWLETLGGSAG